MKKKKTKAKIFYVDLDQKVPLVLACFQVPAAPRLEDTDSDKKYALFGLDTQITIFYCRRKKIMND
jgi:hypothetical protein